MSATKGNSRSAAERGDVGEVGVPVREKGDEGGLFVGLRVGLRVAPGEAGVGLLKLLLF